MKSKPKASRSEVRTVRFEPLEERTLLSTVPNFFTPVAEESASYYLVSTDSSTIPNAPVDVSGVFDELWDKPTESAEGSAPSEAAPSQEQLVIVPNLFAVLDSNEFSEVDVSCLTSSSSASGGSSGGGAELNAAYSGGGIEYENGWLVTEGQTILITVAGGVQGDVVSATISHGATNANDVTLDVSQAVVGSTSAFQISITSDSLWNEGNENFSVELSVTSGSSTLSRSSFSFTIVELPEFISDDDINSETNSVNYIPNDDYYRAYVTADAAGGTAITCKCPTGISAAESGVVYSIVRSGDVGNLDFTPELDLSQCFTIGVDSVTGTVTVSLGQDYSSSYFVQTYGIYSCELVIRASYAAYQGISGGDAFTDDAILEISFGHWEVDRDPSEAKATAIAHDGCTIANLAYNLGLNESEFASWLTIQNEDQNVELCYNVNVPTSLLSSSNILTYSNRFSVPNVIYAAYCYDPAIKESSFGWTDNISGFNSLGFKVVEFNNSSYTVNQSNTALTDFYSGIFNLSNSKSLQGIYLVGHGSNNSFSTHGSSYDVSWGPQWSICYWSETSISNSIDVNLNYKLGVAIVHACDSSNGVNALASTGNSIKHGESETTYPYLHFWADEWGRVVNNSYIRIGGAQYTSVFYRSTNNEN